MERKLKLPETLSVSVPKAYGKNQVVKVEDLPDSTLVRLLEYGATRFVNDKTGGRDDQEKRELTKLWLDKLHSGDVGRGGGGGRKTDPVEHEAQNIVIGILVAKKGLNMTQARDLLKERGGWAAVAGSAETQDAILQKAKKIVASRSMDIEL